ncbi:MAG: Xaa-Pro peptidase family protein, partial [Clostridiales bacterium]|nr:Xaa-Pro peptidase family protein [Clostridiales bacterium]
MFEKKVDAYLILSPANRQYFTGIDTSFGAVVLIKDRKLFFTDFRYAGYARRSLNDFDVQIVTYAGLYKAVADALQDLDVKTVGYEENYITVGEFKSVKAALGAFTLKPAADEIAVVRAVKTEDEIRKIIASQRIAEKALSKVVPLIKPGVTEREISAELTFEMIRLGADTLAFENIVSFGENSADPHHHPSDKKLDKNELILIDFGARKDGYCSDMTRTFTIGNPPEELKLIHNIVLEAQSYALKHIKAGMTGKEADSLAREYIKANGYDKEFGHSLGHGVGVEIHEEPRLSLSCDTVLELNMVVTVEPGIYIDGLGGVRIEDM